MIPVVHFGSVKGALAKMCLAVIFVTWIVQLVSYWPIFSMSLVIFPEVFVKVNLTQFHLVSKVAYNTPLDLRSSDDTKASFNNCFIIHSK